MNASHPSADVNASDSAVTLEASLAELQLQNKANAEPQGRNVCQKISLDQLVMHLYFSSLISSGHDTDVSLSLVRSSIFRLPSHILR
jgi:hypothetical protein